MTDAEIRARKEINGLKEFDALNATDAESHKANESAFIKRVGKACSHLRDNANNNITDFFIDNGVDNHNFNSKKTPSHKDIHEDLMDTIRAVKGDTNTLLHE